MEVSIEQRVAEHTHISPELLAALTEPGAPEEERIISHLAECPRCTAVWAEFVRARSRFVLGAAADMPPESLLEMAKRIPNASAASKTPRASRPNWQRAAAVVTTFAAGIVILVAWQANRHEPKRVVCLEQERAVSDRVRQDSFGGLLYARDLLPRRRGTRGVGPNPNEASLEPLLEKHAGVPPTVEDAWWFVADLLAANRLRDAESYLLGAKRRFPENAGLHNLGAILAYKQNDLATAESELRQALDIQPNAAAESFNLAFVLQQQGRTDEVRVLRTEIAQLFPDSVAVELLHTLSGEERESATP